MTSNGQNQQNSPDRVALAVGDRFVTTIEKVAHGGHFIARHLGAVIFVRHGIPGEEVEIEITSTGSSFNRADVVKVISASSDRVSAPCQFAHRAGCGGCDFQHISLERQRQLKSEVITEQFARIAKKEVAGNFGLGSDVLAAIATDAPSRAARRAIARPIPRDPPVINIRLPERSPEIVITYPS